MSLGPTWGPHTVHAGYPHTIHGGPTWGPRTIRAGPTWDPRTIRAGPTWDPCTIQVGPTILLKTGVMEASLSDYCRQQGELRQGCGPTAAPVEEMIVRHT